MFVVQSTEGAFAASGPCLLQAGQTYQQPSVDPCDLDKQNFGQCLQNNNNDVTACQFVFEALQTCQLEAKKNYN